LHSLLCLRVDCRSDGTFDSVVAVQRNVCLLAVPADRRSAGPPRPTSARSLTLTEPARARQMN